MRAKILLIRHGQTLWNHERRYQGQKDIPLNDRGRREASLLAARLKRHYEEYPIGRIWSSDLARARETAGIIGDALGLDVSTHTGLREINFGAWEGLTPPEAERVVPENVQAYRRDPVFTAPVGGEAYNEVVCRVGATLEEIIGAGDRVIAVVAHGGSLKAALCILLGLDPALRLRLIMDNTALTVVRYHRGMGSLLLYNDTCHLRHEMDVPDTETGVPDAETGVPTGFSGEVRRH